MIESDTAKPRRIPPPVYFLIAALVMAGLHYYVPGPRFIDPPLTYFGCAVFALALGVVVVIKRRFDAAGTTIKPFEESSALVKAAAPSLSGRAETCSAGCHTALENAIITQPDARDPKMVEKLSAVAGRALKT